MVNRVERPNTRHSPAVAVECGPPLVCRHPEVRLQLSLNIKPKVDYRIYVHHRFTPAPFLSTFATRDCSAERAHTKAMPRKRGIAAASAISNTHNFCHIINL
jgi:hypothetical protein